MNLKTKDLHKIIDDAMEKKDREVTIFIGKECTHITVSPLENTKPRWIYYESDGYGNCQCSECGITEKYPSPYCPQCGEKLAMPDPEEGKDDDNG